MDFRAAVYTLGCKLNQCESEALASSFDSRGFFIEDVRSDADLYIINTCTVTSKAEQKARRMIRKLSTEHPGSVVLVTGCYAQLDEAEVSLGGNVVVVPHDRKDEISRLPVFLKDLQDDRDGLIGAVRGFFGRGSSQGLQDPDRFWYESVDFNYHTRAFLKIQDGCDNSCAYCRVTIARGRGVSLPPEEVLRQFSGLLDKGYREIVLTGVNLTSYNSQGYDFSRILTELAVIAGTDGPGGHPAARIRLSSLEPETIDDRMALAVSSPAVCPHFHIPVQSGSDRILSLMRRHNNRAKIIDAVKTLRNVKDDPFLAADVIAGFPGETDEDYGLTLSLVEECEFAHLHVFPFSPRPGTLAEKMKNPVPERISGQRTGELRRLSGEYYLKYASGWIGRDVDVLIEDENGEKWNGTSENYLKSTVCDIINKDGTICRAKIEAVENNGIICRFLEWI